MPLEKSASDAARDRNIGEMRRAGYPRDQAVAAAYDNQRRMRRVHGQMGSSHEAESAHHERMHALMAGKKPK